MTHVQRTFSALQDTPVLGSVVALGSPGLVAKSIFGTTHVPRSSQEVQPSGLGLSQPGYEYMTHGWQALASNRTAALGGSPDKVHTFCLGFIQLEYENTTHGLVATTPRLWRAHPWPFRWLRCTPPQSPRVPSPAKPPQRYLSHTTTAGSQGFVQRTFSF